MGKAITFLSSLKFTLVLIVIVIVASTVGTFLNQSEANVAIYHSAWFAFLLGLLELNLVLCTLKRLKGMKLKKLGFLAIHLGVALVLAGALAGSIWGIRGYVSVSIGKTAASFRLPDKSLHPLPFEITLDDFKVEYYDYGQILAMGGPLEKPLYMKAIPGNAYQLKGTDYVLGVMTYLPNFCMDMGTKKACTRNFIPENPALLVQLTKGEENREVWLFARYPEMQGTHRGGPLPFKLVYDWAEHVKAYKSFATIKKSNGSTEKAVIEVNRPLELEGFSLYQSGYDTAYHSYSQFQVVSDPGLYIVYAGFLLVVAGVVFVLYLKPFLKKRDKGSPAKLEVGK